MSNSIVESGANENRFSTFSSIIAIPSTEFVIFSICLRKISWLFFSGGSRNSIRTNSSLSLVKSFRLIYFSPNIELIKIQNSNVINIQDKLNLLFCKII